LPASCGTYVVALRYRIVTDEGRDFEKAAPFEAELPAFFVRMADGVLILRPRMLFASLEEAREAAADFLRAWEINAALLYRAAAPFRLRYAGGEMERRTGTSTQVLIEDVAHVTDEASSHVSHARYPPCPASYQASPEAEAIWARLERHWAGYEPLLSMAYFALTVLTRAGGIDAASMRYRIDKAILRRIGELTSTRGDTLTARKLTMATQTLTLEESDWLLNTMVRIVGHLLFAHPSEWLSE
jgi:hypothetical protein